MAFWQENYGFIKDVYDWRHQKMVEWMELVERVCFIYYWIGLDICHIYICQLSQAIGRIMADKVYTSAEFKRERDNFTVRPANKL